TGVQTCALPISATDIINMVIKGGRPITDRGGNGTRGHPGGTYGIRRGGAGRQWLAVCNVHTDLRADTSPTVPDKKTIMGTGTIAREYILCGKGGSLIIAIGIGWYAQAEVRDKFHDPVVFPTAGIGDQGRSGNGFLGLD